MNPHAQPFYPAWGLHPPWPSAPPVEVASLPYTSQLPISLYTLVQAITSAVLQAYQGGYWQGVTTPALQTTFSPALNAHPSSSSSSSPSPPQPIVDSAAEPTLRQEQAPPDSSQPLQTFLASLPIGEKGLPLIAPSSFRVASSHASPRTATQQSSWVEVVRKSTAKRSFHRKQRQASANIPITVPSSIPLSSNSFAALSPDNLSSLTDNHTQAYSTTPADIQPIDDSEAAEGAVSEEIQQTIHRKQTQSKASDIIPTTTPSTTPLSSNSTFSALCSDSANFPIVTASQQAYSSTPVDVQTINDLEAAESAISKEIRQIMNDMLDIIPLPLYSLPLNPQPANLHLSCFVCKDDIYTACPSCAAPLCYDHDISHKTPHSCNEFLNTVVDTPPSPSHTDPPPSIPPQPSSQPQSKSKSSINRAKKKMAAAKKLISANKTAAIEERKSSQPSPKTKNPKRRCRMSYEEKCLSNWLDFSNKAEEMLGAERFDQLQRKDSFADINFSSEAATKEALDVISAHAQRRAKSVP